MTGRDSALVKVWRARHAEGVPGRRAAGAERLRISAARGPDLVLDLTRAPAAPGAVLGPGTASGAVPEVSAGAVTAPDGHCADEHLVAGPGEHSPTWLACADVIVRLTGDGPGAPEPPPYGPGLDGLCAGFPGCLVFALVPRGGGHVVVATAFGWRARLVPLGRAPCLARHAASYASAVHAWLVSGRPVDALSTAELTVACGHAPTPEVAVRVMPDARPQTRARAG